MDNSTQDSTVAPLTTREQAQGGFQAGGAAHPKLGGAVSLFGCSVLFLRRKFQLTSTTPTPIPQQPHD